MEGCMCNLNKAIYRDGKQEGRLKGKLEGGKKANIRTICKMLVDDMPAKKSYSLSIWMKMQSDRLLNLHMGTHPAMTIILTGYTKL